MKFLPSIVFLILCLWAFASSFGQSSQPFEIEHHVFSTANLADLDINDPFVKAVNDLIGKTNEPFSMVYDGDITNNNLLNSEEWQGEFSRIRDLLGPINKRPNGKQVIVPGDRDWLNSQNQGLENVNALGNLIDSLHMDQVLWTPPNGCPGPKVIKMSENLILIVINTQWWNHPFDKPTLTDAACEFSTEEDFFEALEDIIVETNNKNIIVAGHFPLQSSGIYGGRIPLKNHLVPFPLFGSIQSAYRQNIGSTKDLVNARFKDFRKKLSRLFFNSNTNLIYLTGHEHNLQIVKDEERYMINSGASGRASNAARMFNTLYNEAHRGLIDLVYYEDGAINARVYRLRGDSLVMEKDITLYQSACRMIVPDIPINTSYLPCRVSEAVPIMEELTLPDSSTTIGGAGYKAGFLERVFMGSLYRSSWGEAIDVPYLNLDTTYQGLTLIKKGGGKQTLSLKFKGGNGKEYVFRSVDKDPIKVIPEAFRNSFIIGLARQFTAAQHPYGAIAADQLLNQTDILHVSPKLYLLPKDQRLGQYREKFGNMLGMLEESPKKGKRSTIGSFNADEILKSFELFTRIYQSHDYQVDVDLFAQARLFDMWIGDPSREEDNWKWAGYKGDSSHIFLPIPRDRDLVFPRINGLIPWMVDREWAVKMVEGFGSKIHDIKSLNYSARHLDRLLLTEYDREDWLQAAKYFQTQFSDSVIDAAVLKMPTKNHQKSGKDIGEMLKQRLKDLDVYALAYYELLARFVDIVGSNESEYIEVIRNADGTVSVEVFLQTQKGKSIFFRNFKPEETREIRIFALGGDDIIYVSGKSKSSIKVRIVGGKGEDQIFDESSVKKGGKHTRIYELEGNVAFGKEGQWLHPRYIWLYDYNQHAFEYDSYLPLPYLDYSSDFGFAGGVSLAFTYRSFDKEKYSHKQNIAVYGTTESNFGINYSGRYHHVFRKWDIQTAASWELPTRYNYFFGFGNDTKKDSSLFLDNYYRTRYNTITADVGLIREFWSGSSNFSATLHYENNEPQLTSPTILTEELDVFGEGKVNIFSTKLGLDFDFRDHEDFPNRGTRLTLSHENGLIQTNGWSNYGLSEISLSFFATTYSKMPLTLGIRVGAADSYGEIPFYKQFSLGQRNHLHGFFRYRFTGDAMAYLNAELRWQLFTWRSAPVPLTIGVTGFNDFGRIFQDGEVSKTWHQGFGGGLFFIPVKRKLALNVSLGFSAEERMLLLLNLGTLLN